MAIVEPILAFTLSRMQPKPAYEPGPPPPRADEHYVHRLDGTTASEMARVAARGNGLRETDFDYAAVPVENVAEINKLVLRIKASHKRHLEAVYEIGADLLRAKELLGHGNFLPWLQAEFRWSDRTANNYMSIARFFQGKSANFADLDVGTAAALASRSTPVEIRKELLGRADAGEIITRDEVNERLAAAREALKSAKAAARIARSEVSAPAGVSEERPTPPRAIVEHLNADEFMRLASPMRPLNYPPALAAPELVPPTSDSGARKTIEAMVELATSVDSLSTGGSAQVVEALLAAGNEQDLSRVQKLIGFVLEIKQALDDNAGARRDLDLRRAS
jgi:hypothetical protein